MNTVGDYYNAAVMGEFKLSVSQLEPTTPVSGDIWVDPVSRTFQVFTGTVWQDFIGAGDDIVSPVWDSSTKRWVASAPKLVSPDGTVFTLTVSDAGELSAVAD